MKTTKTIVFALSALLCMSSLPSMAQTFKFKALENIRISKSIYAPVDSGVNPLDEVAIKPNDKIPTCEVNLNIGDIDCMNRLYVDRAMLEKLIAGSEVFSNDGEVFNSYADSKINTYYVNDMSMLFYGKNVAYSIVKWDVSNVTNMRLMFYGTRRFNQPIGNWSVKRVTNMDYMFGNNSTLTALRSDFNQNLNNWDVCNVQSQNEFTRGATSLSNNNLPFFDKRNCN